MTSAEMVDFKKLPAGATIDVETKNRNYHIECLGGDSIRISGHPDYCPTPVHALLRGSVDKEGELEFGLVGRGMRLVFLLDDHRPITTTRVERLRLESPAPTPPSVH